MRRLSLLLLPLPLLACVDPNFNKPGLLKLPRVLAVQAEPPQPSVGTSTTLRALIYLPTSAGDAATGAGGDTGPQYEWSWCPLPTTSMNGYACPIQDQTEWDQLFTLLGLHGVSPRILGTGETATLTNPFPAALLNSICKGEIPMLSPKLVAGTCRYSAGDHINADDPATLANSHPLGFPVTILLKYTPPPGSPPQDNFGTPLTTVFTVFLPTDDTVPPNQNPTVGDIYLDPLVKGSVTITPTDAGASPDGEIREPADGGTNDDSGTNLDAGASDGGGASDDGGSSLDGGGAAPDSGGTAGDLPPPPAGSFSLATAIPREKRVGLWLDVPLSSVELLPRPSVLDVVKDSFDPAQMQVYYIERLNLAWFAEAGDFGGAHGSGGLLTGYNPDIDQKSLTSADDDRLEQYGRENLIALPAHEDYPDSRARIIVVVRDNRGGVTWTSGTITMEDRP
jgi:hypothetical protein